MTRHLIVEVRWGPSHGKKAVVPPGETLRVGRADDAGLAAPQDSHMSAAHFELTWDGSRCVARDLGSIEGTLLRGARFDEVEVPNGGWIRAGQTDFVVYIEGHTPPRLVEDDDLSEEASEQRAAIETNREAFAERALDVLEAVAEVSSLFAIVDAARDDRILEVVRESVEEYRSLYEGVQGEALAEVAPYLVRLSPGSRLLQVLVKEGWMKRWGIFCTCRLPFKDVRRHFRRFLMIEEEATGEPLYFRYYDPWVFRVFLPTCTARQKQQLFGEIEAFFFEGQHGELVRESLPLPA